MLIVNWTHVQALLSSLAQFVNIYKMLQDTLDTIVVYCPLQILPVNFVHGIQVMKNFKLYGVCHVSLPSHGKSLRKHDNLINEHDDQ